MVRVPLGLRPVNKHRRCNGVPGVAASYTVAQALVTTGIQVYGIFCLNGFGVLFGIVVAGRT